MGTYLEAAYEIKKSFEKDEGGKLFLNKNKLSRHGVFVMAAYFSGWLDEDVLSSVNSSLEGFNLIRRQLCQQYQR